MEQLPNVRLLPPADNIEEILRQTRVLLIPSLWTENFPLTVTEAMLRGIPVIGSNSGGLPETKRGVDYVIPVRLITQYEDRFDELGNPVPIIPDQDIKPWEETLQTLLSDRHVYEHLSAVSQVAALNFVSGIGIEPFEHYFENLKPAAQIRHSNASKLTKKHGAGANDLDSVLSKLSPERLELLALRLKKKNENALPITQAINRRSEANSVPLSFAQQRLWFIDQFDPANPAYNNQDAFRLTGSLNMLALGRAINEIVRRHEALRTTFSTVDEQPVQIVARNQRVPLPVIDLSQVPETERESQALHLVREESRHPFNLSQGPLLRTSLVRLGEEDHIFVIGIHHVVSDGWSGGVLFHELTALYQAFSKGRPSPLPELPIQYADYAVWQREWLQGEVLEEHLAHWKQQLTGAPTVLELQTDHPRPAVQSFRGASQSFAISTDTADALRSLSLREGATLFMTLLGAFQTLLWRYTGQTDVVVGTDVAGRAQAGTEKLIGFFANHLVLRTDLSGDPSFRQLLRRVREMALGAYAYQDMPFEKLVEALKPKRSLSHTPLFQVLFTFLNTPRQLPELPGLTVSLLKIDSGMAKYDLTLFMNEAEPGLSGTFEYKADLFDPQTIAQMASRFKTLLESIVAQPDARLNELCATLLGGEKKQLILEKKEREESNFKKFKNVQPKLASATQGKGERDCR